MVQGRVQGGVVGGVVGNCARTRFLVRILHFLNLVEKKKIPQKSFWKLPRSLGDFSICILPFMHTWILSRTRDGCPSKRKSLTENTWVPKDYH